jgi:iron(III) transport system permease protein
MSEVYLWEPLKNSLTVGILASAVSIPLGGILAWIVVRSDIPFKKTLGMLVVIPYMIPSWCKSIAWLAIFRNERCGSPGILGSMGFSIPDWLAYGPIAIALVLMLHYYAFTYIMVTGALRSINSELEEMGAIQGASTMQILKSITFPLILPSVLSAAIMTLSKSIGTYGVAANLGSRIGFFTLSTKMGNALDGGKTSFAYIMALVLITLATGTIFGNQILIGVRKSYASIAGKGGRKTLMSLGRAKPIVGVFLVLFLAISFVVPMAVLVLESFLKDPVYGYALNNFTLYNWVGTLQRDSSGLYTNYYTYPGIFRNPDFLSSLWNTIKLTVIASVITALCGQFIGYISSRGRGKWYGNLTEQLVFIPYLIPSVAFAAIYLAMWGERRWIIPSMYGTFAIILLVSIVKHFPFASRAGTANMLQIGIELEEAADINGAGFFCRMRNIVIPLAKQGFLSGLMLVFISIAKELDLIILLMTPKNRTLPYLAFHYSLNELPQMSDAVTICMIAFVLVSYYLANRFAGADVGKSWG